jgi:hypothetical protein
LDADDGGGRGEAQHEQEHGADAIDGALNKVGGLSHGDAFIFWSAGMAQLDLDDAQIGFDPTAVKIDLYAVYLTSRPNRRLYGVQTAG